MRTKEEQEKGCPRASEEVFQRKGGKASEGGSQERGKSITKGWPRRGREASESDLVPEHWARETLHSQYTKIFLHNTPL